MIVPIRPLGFGSFGIVYLVYDLEYGIVAAKISIKNKIIQKEWEAAVDINRKIKSCPFILKYLKQLESDNCSILLMEYASLKTLDIIVKYPQIPLPMSTLRALMKQILEGMNVFHDAGFVHRDIKCDNILLHSPPNTGLVHAKISDFGFAKVVGLTHEQIYLAGTLPYMAIELFNEPIIVTQKVDIYALGITFYRLITHCYPLNEQSPKDQKKKLSNMKMIQRPSKIKNDILWDLLSKMLEFDPNKRISASEALEHEFFTNDESFSEIFLEQKKIANQSAAAQHLGNQNISEYDLNSLFIVE
ncbi:MAG: putative CAMK/RAD53 protein kinase Cds1, partial [Streblomastix strix]